MGFKYCGRVVVKPGSILTDRLISNQLGNSQHPHVVYSPVGNVTLLQSTNLNKIVDLCSASRTGLSQLKMSHLSKTFSLNRFPHVRVDL